MTIYRPEVTGNQFVDRNLFEIAKALDKLCRTAEGTHTHVEADITDLNHAAPIFAQITQDESHTGDTDWTDIPGLALPMEANKAYYFKFGIHFEQSGSGDGFITVNGPTANSVFFNGMAKRSATLGDVKVYEGRAYQDSVGQITATSAEWGATVEGVINNGPVADDLALQFKTDNSAGTVTAFAYSFGVMWEVADSTVPEAGFVTLDVPEEQTGSGSEAIVAQFYADPGVFGASYDNLKPFISGDFTYSSGMTVKLYEGGTLDTIDGTERVSITSTASGELSGTNATWANPATVTLYKITINGSASDTVRGLSAVLKATV